MLPWGRKKQRGPQTDEEILAEAFEGVRKQQERREVRRRREFLWRKYVDARMLWVLAVIFVLVIADGVRRENMEFYATVTAATGSGQVRTSLNGPIEPLAAEMRIEDGGEVQTGPNCWATLGFPDGSVITLAPGSHLKVELLEYNRGGRWRGRSFTLNFGSMWARVSPKFGEQSRCRIHTPSSVAAVRGTRFYVGYDPTSSDTQVSCSDGAVQVDGFRGRSALIGQGASTAVSYGAEPQGWQPMDPQTRASFGLSSLNQQVEPDPWLKRLELQITAALDLPLSMLGIGKSAWAVGAADFARRAAAMEALRYIHQSITGPAEYPEFVDPFTLRELDFRPQDALRILKNLDGASLVKYERTDHGFVIWARARDRARTPYKLTPFGVEQVTEDQFPGL